MTASPPATGRARGALAALAAALLVAACAGAAPSPSPSAAPTAGPSASASADPAPTAVPTPPAPSPSLDPGPLPAAAGRAGLDWVRIVPPSWSLFEPRGLAAGPGGLLATGVVLRTEPQLAAASWHDGRGWLAVPPAGVPARVPALDVPVAAGEGFAIIGSLWRDDGPNDGAAWRSGPGPGPWTLTPAPAGWGPRAAAPLAGGWLVLANTMTGLGGPPESTWWTADFAAWREVPLAAGFPYASILRGLPDGSLVVAGRLSPQAVDVAPVPLGELSLWRTADGTAWVRTALTGAPWADASLEDLAIREGRWVAFGRRWPAGANPDLPAPTAFWWSDDGTTWRGAAGPATLPWLDGQFLVATDDRFVLLGTLDGLTRVLAVSADGTAWEAADGPVFAGRVTAVATAGDLLVAVGSLPEAEGGGGAYWATPLGDR